VEKNGLTLYVLLRARLRAINTEQDGDLLSWDEMRAITHCYGDVDIVNISKSHQKNIGRKYGRMFWKMRDRKWRIVKVTIRKATLDEAGKKGNVLTQNLTCPKLLTLEKRPCNIFIQAVRKAGFIADVYVSAGINGEDAEVLALANALSGVGLQAPLLDIEELENKLSEVSSGASFGFCPSCLFSCQLQAN
jgi:hypothetical protein